MRKFAAAALAVAGLASCQSFQSRHVDLDADQMATGMHYSVPKALMTVELQQNGGDLFLGVSRPFLIGDPEATYTLSASSGLFADQRYKVRVDPQTRLLAYISSVSRGQAPQILANIGGAFGALGPGMKTGDENSIELLKDATQVFSHVFDPLEAAGCEFGGKCNLSDLSDELHNKAYEFLRCDRGANSVNPDRCSELGDTNERRNARGELERYFSITLDPLFKVDKPVSAADRRGSAASACAASICYRAPAPYLMRVVVKGQRDVSEIVMLPNEGPIMALDLPAGVFATARSRVDLVYGMPARMEVDQGNELVGITAIPLTVIRSFFTAAGEVFRIRINYNSEHERMLRSDLSRQEAQDAYDDAQQRRRDRDAANATSGLTPNSTEPADEGGDDFDNGTEPENSLDYIDNPDDIVAEPSQLLNVTIVQDPAPMLFLVPLQPTSRVKTDELPEERLDGGSPS